jgi:predicted phage-related endonuclease
MEDFAPKKVEELAPLSSSLARTQSELAQVNEEISLALKDMIERRNALEERDKKIREEITKAMKARVEAGGEKKYEDDNITVTYVAPTRRAGIDIAKLKAEKPDIYKKYEKFTPVKESVRLKVKG